MNAWSIYLSTGRKIVSIPLQFQTDFPHLVDSLSASTGALPLQALALLRATGPEARSFLQNQLTNDLRQVSSSRAQLAGYCSPKGRLLAVMTVQQLAEDDFALLMPSSLAAPTLKRLRMFVLRSKLTLSDASGEFDSMGLMGAEAAAQLAKLGLPAPAEAYAAHVGEAHWLLRCPGPVPRFELRAAPAQIAAWRATLALPELPPASWALAEVLAGTPQVSELTVDRFVPQTIDLDRAGGVSFTKGCYPGQEIVARVHYLGRAKQRLRLAKASSLLAAGTPVLDATGHSVGEVMACAEAGADQALASLSLNVSYGTAPLHSADGRTLWPVPAPAETVAGEPASTASQAL